MRMLSPLSREWSWPRASMTTDALEQIFNDFDRAFGADSASPQVSDKIRPSCDVSETSDHFLISMDMPGVKKEDVQLQLDGNRLLVSGERLREVEENAQDRRTHRYERSYGKFERSFELPTNVQGDKIEAHYEDGVLNIAVPKAEHSKRRPIEIQSGKSGLFSKLLKSPNSKQRTQ